MSLVCNGTDAYAANVSPLSGFPAINGNQTISAWFRYTSGPSGSRTLVAVSVGSSGVRLGFSNPGGGTVPTVRKYDGTILAQASVLPSTGVWHHMAYTFDGTTHRLYIDGVQDGTSTTAADAGTPDSINYGRNSDDTEFFSGLIDDVRVYNRVLSANGVQTISNCLGHDGITSGLVGRWGFRAGAKGSSGVGYAYAEVTTNQSHSADTNWTDIPGASISSSSFIPGRQYLVVVNGQFSKPSGNTPDISMRTIHGSTAFSGAEIQVRQGSAETQRRTYTFFTVWTAVSGEEIKAQFKTTNTLSAVNANFVTLLALDLTRFVEGVDWHFNENTTATAVGSTTWSTTNNGSITFTPPTGGQDWLVMTLSQLDPSVATVNSESRINRSGEATSTLPLLSQEPNNGVDIQMLCNMRVFNLGNASNTFAEQSRSDAATTLTRNYSSVFAINLSKFSAHANAYTEAAETLSTTDYATQTQTASMTATADSHAWILASIATDTSTAGGWSKARVQVDGSDAPSGQTTEAYERQNQSDITNLDPVQNQVVTSVASGSRTVDLDASGQTLLTTTSQYRHLSVAQLEPGALVNDLSSGGNSVVMSTTASFGETALARRRRNP